MLDFLPSGGRVRTFSAIVLSILMGLPIAAPLFAPGQTNLPACCRRNGTHHCMLHAELRTDSDSNRAISRTEAKCPRFPQVMGITVHGQLGLSASASVFAAVISHPAVSPQTLSNYRISLVRSHQKRGPPNSVLS